MTTESIDYPEQMRRDREEIARLQGCPIWPACGCGTQSGPHTCEWKKMAAEIAHLTTQRDQLRRERTEFDCRYTLGDVADFSGQHCPPKRPCMRCQRDQLLAALKFYADEENWREEGSVLYLGSQVRADEGEIARAAIAAVEEKP
jgi:hypothetical protein